MLKKIKHIINNNGLLKLGAFNSVSIVIKILASIISSKALAIFVGPSGLAFIGIFKDFSTMAVNMSSLGLQKGLVKYTAELKSQSNELKIFLNTSKILMLTISILVGVVFFALSEPISKLLSPHYDFSFVIEIFALVIPVSVFNLYFISVLNGLQYTSHILRINTLLYILNMIAIVIMSYFMGTKGALLAISIFFILQFISIIVYKPKSVSLNLLSKVDFSRKFTKKLLGYTAMTLFSLFLFPVISIWIRGAIISDVGEEAAGFWEAMKRISDNYLLFASSLVMLFVLPKLSENHHAFKEVISKFFRTILPLFALALFLVFILRYAIITLFFSKEFIPMESLVKWYVLGDFFRIMGMVLAANFYARRNIIGYFITDMFLASIMYISTLFLLKKYGLDGCAMAYLVTYVLYFILLILVFRKKLFHT